jgi:hypothetical protein
VTEERRTIVPARSGQQYIASLQKRQPEVYLNGKRVKDVTQEPLFQAPIRAIAEQYDMQLDPAYRDIMTYPSPSTGEPVSTSFLVPYTRQELVQKRKHFKLRADHNFGFMGRAPDFMNQFITGWHLMADRFARAGARFGENATRYYEYVREHDLFLTHMLINPQIDRSKTSAQQEEPFLHLGRVRKTSDGIVVRGAKMLDVCFVNALPVPWERRRPACFRSGLEARAPRRPYTGTGLVKWTSRYHGAHYGRGRSHSLRRRASGGRRLCAGLWDPDADARPQVPLPRDGVSAATVALRPSSEQPLRGDGLYRCIRRRPGAVGPRPGRRQPR